MDEANPDPNLPVSKADDDENVNNGDHYDDDDNDNDNDDNDNEGEDNEDDNCDVNGPTVQAHVDLAKTACKYCRTQYC